MKAEQQVKVDGNQNIIVQVEGDGNHLNIGRPHLTLIPPRKRAPKVRTEIDLLNPYARAFDLVGREKDMASLWEWLHSQRPITVRTVTGRAGAGKTRLAIELIERLHTTEAGQWWAGFVSGTEIRRFGPQQNLAGWGWAKPALIVVDYAASLTEPLREWLRELAQNDRGAEGRPLRLLLLEREASADTGWLQFLCRGGQGDAGVTELFDPLEPKRLELLNTGAKRRAVLIHMLAAAAELAKTGPPKLPEPGQNPPFDKQLEQAEWEDPLYLMMAALLSLSSDLVEVLALPRTALALKLVDHETNRFTEGVSGRDAGRLLIHLCAFAAMGSGLSQEQALVVAEEECAALKLQYPGGPGAMVNRLHEVLPAPDQGIAPIIPDILAEALVLKAMKECSIAQQGAAVLRAVKNLGRRVIPFTVRTVQDFGPAGEAAPLNWLESFIKAGQADDLALLVEIGSAMPQKTLVLREKAVEVVELLAARWSEIAKGNPTEAVMVQQSRFLNNLANRLSDLGRSEEALAQAEEAVRINRQLNKARPDAFLPDLAMSLNTLSNSLSALGRREEALVQVEESVRIRRQLAAVRPDAFQPNLADSLNNLANVLSYLGRREEALTQAEETVRIRSQLAAARPHAFLPALAMSLNNLSAKLSDLGRREAALAQAAESVRMYRQLAAARPDAFVPDLMMSLHNLANMLGNLGRHEEALARAEESVRTSQQLADVHPDAFLPILATSLNNLAKRFDNLGRHEEALARAEESVRICQQLAQERSEAFLPDLGQSLNTLAVILGTLGRREEALARAEESVRIRRQLAAARQHAFLLDLAGALNTLANSLSALGRREDALARAEESVRIYRQLAATRPHAFRPDLAIAMNNLANRLSALGRREEALAQAEESVQIHRQLAAARPDAVQPDLARSLNTLATVLKGLGRLEEALGQMEESVRIREQLAAVRPAAFLPSLARSFGAQGTILQGMSNHVAAAASFAKGIKVVTPLFQETPSTFADLIGNLRKNYIGACEHAKMEPDMALLAPVVEVFEKLKQNPDKE